ncbi:SH3 domain-containing protein [Anaerococcus sp. Marseille-Q5996]|uniref:SH3 domain-containing protein n=1 Tax=Anaerococcus sp. Marseille-Q5996 TaxID=2972769 RepID=UPI0021C70233|nr:SH3 domain-containing protein [Anaerococcus sp. Marseille-Q5996]
MLCLFSLTACKNDDNYKDHDIKIYENKKQGQKDDSPQIGGLYEVSQKTDIYADMDEKSAYDKLDAGSVVKIVNESEDGFVRVEFNGDSLYIKTKYLKEI